MKKLKSKKSSLKNRIKQIAIDLKKDPFGVVLDFFKSINLYLETNVLFCAFVLVNVINGVMVRYFTAGGVNNLIAFQPLLADIAIIVALGALGYFMRHGWRVFYWFIITIIQYIMNFIRHMYLYH